MATIGWYLIGFAFAYGDVGNSFIGEKYFGLQDVNDVSRKKRMGK